MVDLNNWFVDVDMKCISLIKDIIILKSEMESLELGKFNACTA